MKRYLAPELEICAFRAEDIVTASSGGVLDTLFNVISGPATFDGKLKGLKDQDEE